MTVSLMWLYFFFLLSERIIQLKRIEAKFSFYWIIYTLLSLALPMVVLNMGISIVFYILCIFLRSILKIIYKDKDLIISLVSVPLLLIIFSFLFNKISLWPYIKEFWLFLSAGSYLFMVFNENIEQILNVIIGCLLICFESNNFIRFFLAKYEFRTRKAQDNGEEKKEQQKEARRGYAIGVLERLIIYTLIFLGKPEAITLVIAAKAVYRYKTLDDRDFSEYVLIGSLLSLVISVVLSYLLISMFF